MTTPAIRELKDSSGNIIGYQYPEVTQLPNGTSVIQWQTHFLTGSGIAAPHSSPSEITNSVTAAGNAQLAKDKFAYEKQQANFDRQLAAQKLEMDKAALEYKKAIDARDYERANRIHEEQTARQAKLDTINEQQRTLENDFRDKQFQAQRGDVAFNQGITREQQNIANENQRNQPGNYYNIAFRQRGMEPPGPGQTAGIQAPEGSSTAATRDISQWRNMSIRQLLATFSATELARLPLEALAQFSNEDKLKIGEQYPGGVDAFLRLFPKEVQQTFGQDVQNRINPPAPATANATTGMYPAGYEAQNPNVGQQLTEWQTARSQAGQDPHDTAAFRQHLIDIGAPDFGVAAGPGEAIGPVAPEVLAPKGAAAGSGNASIGLVAPPTPIQPGVVKSEILQPGGNWMQPSQPAPQANIQAPQAAAPTEQDAIAAAERIKRQMQGVAA